MQNIKVIFMILLNVFFLSLSLFLNYKWNKLVIFVGFFMGIVNCKYVFFNSKLTDKLRFRTGLFIILSVLFAIVYTSCST